MGLFWTIGNNYGREAAASLNIKRSLELGKQLASMNRSFFSASGNIYGREAAAVLLASINNGTLLDNLNYGREAIVFLYLATGINKLWFTFGRIFELAQLL